MSADAASSATTAVREALPAFGLQEGDLTLVKYRENHVFRLVHRRGEFAVRLHRAQYNSTAAINAELELLNQLAVHGFTVPGVIKAADGDLHTSTTHNGTTRTVSVLTWIPDAAPLGDIESAFDGTSTVTPDHFRRVGELAGRLHNHLSAHATDLSRLRPRWDFDGLVGPHAVWGDPFALPEIASARPLLNDAVAKMQHHLARVGTSPENFSLIHADFTPENVLLAGEDLVLIDFDDCGAGWHPFELATMLFWFQPHPGYGQFKDALLDGYAHARGQIEDELLTAMLLARGLTYLGWAAARRGDPTAEFIAEHLVPQVTENAAHYLAVAPAR
jgi:Ser/Thr protein kinase RdoA (MazF antagonist)